MKTITKYSLDAHKQGDKSTIALPMGSSVVFFKALGPEFFLWAECEAGTPLTQNRHFRVFQDEDSIPPEYRYVMTTILVRGIARHLYERAM